MKKLIFFLPIFILFACSENKTETVSEEQEVSVDPYVGFSFFGDTLAERNPNTIEAVYASIDEYGGAETQIEGTILEACQKKGCWMKVDVEGYEQPIRVTFKDYGFFVPKDSDGQLTVMEGVAYYDTVSVEVLQHYAEDAGKSQDEIDAITEPEIALAFEATGVAIQN